MKVDVRTTPMFRFTIREMVLLTMVVGMGVGWWLDRSTQARAVKEARNDAIAIAEFTSGRVFGLENSDLIRLQKKYGADPEKIRTLRRMETKN
jgi:hypothetical protein